MFFDRVATWVRIYWPPELFVAGLATNSVCFCFLFVFFLFPHRGNTFLFRSSKQLPRLRLGPLKGFFELTRRPSRALNSPCALLLELQRYKDTDVPLYARRSQDNVKNRTPKTLRLMKRTFLHRSLIVKSKQNRIELVTRPGS